MDKRLAVLAIPIALVPYLALFALATILLSTEVPFFRTIMESLFQNNAITILIALFVYCMVVALIGICFFVNTNKNWDALAVAKTAMIIKLAQVPAYILIFFLSVMFVITIFTIPFSVGLFVIDCLTLFMTGLLVISSVVISVQNNTLTFKEVFWIVLFQFVFCADVFASVFLYRKLKTIRNQNQSFNHILPPTLELSLSSIQEMNQKEIVYMDNEGLIATINYLEAHKCWCKAKSIRKSSLKYICDQTKSDGWKIIFYTNPKIIFYADMGQKELWDSIIDGIGLQGFYSFDFD